MFLCTDFGQLSPHLVEISLQDDTENTENGEKSTGENSKHQVEMVPQNCRFLSLDYVSLSCLTCRTLREHQHFQLNIQGAHTMVVLDAGKGALKQVPRCVDDPSRGRNGRERASGERKHNLPIRTKKPLAFILELVGLGWALHGTMVCNANEHKH